MPQTQGSIRPITIPLLSEPANIRDALTQLYYGDPANSGTDPGNTNTDTLYASQNSIAAYIQQLFQDKANLENPIFRKYVDGTTKPGQIGIQNAAGTKSTKITVGAITADLTLTLPLITANDILVSENFVQTLTNKTLITPTINGGTATALTGFSLRDTSAAYNIVVTATSSTTLTAARTLTLDLDNANRTLKLAKGLTIQTGDITLTGNSSGSSVILPTTGTLATLAGTETLTNKTLTAPVIATIVNTGTLTLPTSTDTIVGRSTTDVLTNKTLTSPVIATIINTGTLTLPTSTDTLIGRATTDTLTNKSISGATNTFSNIPNSATTAASINTASAIVARDTSGNFAAGTITATLSGNVTGNVTGNVSGSASRLSGGASGKTQIVYQSDAGSTSYVSSTGAVADYVLTFQGDGSSPVWKNPANLPAVDSALKASNLTGTGILGQLFYESATANSTSRLAPNTSTVKQFLSSTGDGTNGSAPIWSTLDTSNIASGVFDLARIPTISTSKISDISVASGKVLTVSETLTITSPASGRSLNIGTGGTLADTAFIASSTFMLANATSVNGTTIPSGNKTLVYESTSGNITQKSATSGTADKALATVYYGGASGTMNYSTPTNKIYTGATPPSTGMSVGDIWMW